MGRRRAVAGVGLARGARCARDSEVDPFSDASRCVARSTFHSACTDVGSTHARGAGAAAGSSWTDMGGCASRAAACPCRRPIMGGVAACFSARAHVGIARTGAFSICAAPGAVVGPAQACRSGA